MTSQSKIPAKNFSAMTRLDHNRAMAQKCADGTTVGMVKNVIIWGNHSSTQFPDIRHAKIVKGGSETSAYDAVKDTAWIQDQFIKTVQKRGAVIIEKRKLSSAMSASKAACDHMRDWFFGTIHGEHYEVHYLIKCGESFGTLAKLFAEWTGVQVTSLRFLFDGRRVGNNDTPKSLEMDEGAVLEVYAEQRGGEEQKAFQIHYKNSCHTVYVGISKKIIDLKMEIEKNIDDCPVARQNLFRAAGAAPDDANVADYEVPVFRLILTGTPPPV